ncbi:MAG: hypothetical protein Sylvanvirus13_13 [Sylvanvirus sp.]|uniref:Uncharacterized protein n=1 Tax=Sylvanvirus sp. TaxID=2487774 RepID=A0A3G5AIB0_9VIRU|nr:MAG: hypothetical protein Sylvanvirus13_13 [Sylvanvirus sp.]
MFIFSYKHSKSKICTFLAWVTNFIQEIQRKTPSKKIISKQQITINPKKNS